MSLLIEEYIGDFANDPIFRKVMWEYQQKITKRELALTDVGNAFTDGFNNRERMLNRKLNGGTYYVA